MKVRQQKAIKGMYLYRFSILIYNFSGQSDSLKEGPEALQMNHEKLCGRVDVTTD